MLRPVVQQAMLQHFQQCWHGFPGDFSNFLLRIFVFWYSLGLNNSLPIIFFDLHTVSPWLQQEACPCSQTMLRPKLLLCQNLVGGTGQYPPAWLSHGCSAGMHFWSSGLPVIMLSVFLALLVKFIVVECPERTGRERQLPSISSL